MTDLKKLMLALRNEGDRLRAWGDEIDSKVAQLKDPKAPAPKELANEYKNFREAGRLYRAAVAELGAGG